MKPYYRRIRFRPGQRFFLNVSGKIEQYKFVQASYTYDGSVSIIAEPRLIPGEKITLLAQRGFVRREFRRTEKGGTYGDCCIFSGFDRIRTIGMWCGIYFSRRAAKKGICTEKLWEQKFQEIIARPVSSQDQQVGALLGTLSQAFSRSMRADLIDEDGSVRPVNFLPSAKLQDALNVMLTTSKVQGSLRETTKSVIQGTAADIMTAVANAGVPEDRLEYRFSKPELIDIPLPRRKFEWPESIVMRNPGFPIIKGGI